MWISNFTCLNDRKIHWVLGKSEDNRAKDLPVLLFVHGVASKAGHWMYTAERLLKNYDILIIDRPGYGKSEGKLCKSIEECADLIIEWLHSIVIDQPIIYIGHSLGGAIGLASTLKYPNAFDALVLVSSFARFKTSTTLISEEGYYDSERIRVGFSKNTSKSIVDSFVNDVQGSDIKAVEADFLLCDGLDFRDELHNINLPTLIIAAIEDQVVTKRQAECLKNGLNNSKLIIALNAGHNVLIEQPRDLAHNIDSFINETF